MKNWILAIIFASHIASPALEAVPAVKSVHPFAGQASGGAEIEIAGSDFTHAAAVYFGSTPAATFTVISDTQMTAVAPPHVPQVVPVRVVRGDDVSEISPDSYFAFQGDVLGYVINNNSHKVPGEKILSIINTRTATLEKMVHLQDNACSINLLPDGSSIYVTEPGLTYEDTLIEIIEGATGTVVKTLNNDLSPATLGVLPDGQKVYVADKYDDMISVIDTSNNEIIKNLPVIPFPSSVSVTPDASKVLIANLSESLTKGTVQVVDPVKDVVGNPIAIGLAKPNGIAITPDSTKAYVATLDADTAAVIVIDLTGNDPTDAIPVDSQPYAIAITPSGEKAYVVNYNSNKGAGTVSVVDVATNKVINTIQDLSYPSNIMINSKGSYAYIVNQGNGFTSGFVSVVDTSTDEIISNIPAGVGANGIYLTPDNLSLYIPSEVDHSIHVIDLTTNTLTTSIPAGLSPGMVVIAPDQAPLAKFTHSPFAPGIPVVFNASGSVSPTGAIAYYFWDFGDTSTFQTDSPIVEHTFSIDNPTVTLRVVNSAGTSTTQVFNYSTNNNNSQTALSMPIFNNGGPTAQVSKTLSRPTSEKY